MPKVVDRGDVSCGSRAFHEHKDFAVPYVILCEKLRISLRIDPYGGVWVARLDRSNGLTFVRNSNKRPFLQLLKFRSRFLRIFMTSRRLLAAVMLDARL